MLFRSPECIFRTEVLEKAVDVDQIPEAAVQIAVLKQVAGTVQEHVGGGEDRESFCHGTGRGCKLFGIGVKPPRLRKNRVVHVDEGVALINDLLYYDASRPIDDENYPRLYISSDCPNLIYAMREWTYVDKDRGACKDPVDCCRMLVMDDNLMVEDGCMEMRGGGSY